MKSINEEWDDFMNDDVNIISHYEDNCRNNIYDTSTNNKTPKSSDIYISTKTNIGYLNQPIDLYDIFWKIKVNEYCIPQNGVIKKQMKFNSITKEDVKKIEMNLLNEKYVDTNIITHIDNPEGRIKFKDIRKISIGISKKDILSYRCKKKSAFYNCFVLILRILEDGIYKEFHVKVFNTGKLEIPGIQSEESFKNIIKLLISTLKPFHDKNFGFLDNKSETVLINSNFNCGFYINREKLCSILKYKYKIQSIYDPCSYPGIQCKFYYNLNLMEQTGQPLDETINTTLVSFMIFRTGSVLIVGKCDEEILHKIYDFIKDLLLREYPEICQQNNIVKSDMQKTNNKKIRKKTILLHL